MIIEALDLSGVVRLRSTLGSSYEAASTSAAACGVGGRGIAASVV